MKFSAKYLIFLFAAAVVWYMFIVLQSFSQWLLFLIVLAIIILANVSISWTIGWIIPHRRPQVVFPEAKELFIPLSTWKSFPSDHTIIAFALAELPMYFFSWKEDLVSLVAVGSFISIASIISVSRVYAGVHFPRDILGGWLLATGMIWLLSQFVLF